MSEHDQDDVNAGWPRSNVDVGAVATPSVAEPVPSSVAASVLLGDREPSGAAASGSDEDWFRKAALGETSDVSIGNVSGRLDAAVRGQQGARRHDVLRMWAAEHRAEAQRLDEMAASEQRRAIERLREPAKRFAGVGHASRGDDRGPDPYWSAVLLALGALDSGSPLEADVRSELEALVVRSPELSAAQDVAWLLMAIDTVPRVRDYVRWCSHAVDSWFEGVVAEIGGHVPDPVCYVIEVKRVSDPPPVLDGGPVVAGDRVTDAAPRSIRNIRVVGRAAGAEPGEAVRAER